MVIKLFICVAAGIVLGGTLGLIVLAVEKYDRWKNG